MPVVPEKFLEALAIQRIRCSELHVIRARVLSRETSEQLLMNDPHRRSFPAERQRWSDTAVAIHAVNTDDATCPGIHELMVFAIHEQFGWEKISEQTMWKGEGRRLREDTYSRVAARRLVWDELYADDPSHHPYPRISAA